jgi:signal transduction histidine kinase
LAATEDLERTRRRVVVAELAGAAAHELNQPLTSLLGYTELMRRKVTEAEHLRILSKIDSDAKRVADIVGKIGRITDYRTKEYVGGARIMDLDSASEAIDEGEEH